MSKKCIPLLLASLAIASMCAIGLPACGVTITNAVNVSTPSGSGYSLGDDWVNVSGDTLTVSLASNPTTGYQWTSLVTGDVVTLTSDDYTESTSTSNTNNATVTGAGGVHNFVYTGKKAGDAQIKLTYARSWESTSADETITIDVSVDSSGKITSAKAESSTGAKGEFSI